MVKGVFGTLGHADKIETSHMLVIRPDLVEMDKAFDHESLEVPLYYIDPVDTRDTLVSVSSYREHQEELVKVTGGVSGGTLPGPTMNMASCTGIMFWDDWFRCWNG